MEDDARMRTVRDSDALLCGRNLNTIEICVKRLLPLVES